MDSNPPLGGRGRGPLMGLAALALLPLGACQTARPDPGVEETITQATAIGSSLVFRVEGGPLDEPAAGDSLTLSDAIHRAVTTDPGLQAALARVRVAIADADQARLLPNPVLNVVVRWGPGKPQVELSLAQDLVQAIQIPRRASAADNRLREAAAYAVTTALDVVSEVQERYASVQASDALVPLLRERVTLLRKLTDTAKARRQAGEGTRTDVTILDAQRVELEVEIAAAELQREEERVRLARLIGEPSSAAVWALQPWSSPDLTTQPEPRWIEAAIASRPEVQAITWRMAALGDDLALAKLLPWEGAGAGVDAQRDGDWTVGPSVATPVPIFDMGQARRARVTAEQIQARHELTLAKRKVVEEVRVAYRSLVAGRANLVRIRNELIPLQQERRRVTENVYLAERDITPLLLAEQDLRTAQARSIDAERQASVALIRLQRAVGGLGIAAQVAAAPEATGNPASEPEDQNP